MGEFSVAATIELQFINTESNDTIAVDFERLSRPPYLFSSDPVMAHAMKNLKMTFYGM